MASAVSNRFQNRLLQSVPPDELHRFDNYLEPIELPPLTVLAEPGADVEYVHFIEEGMAVVTMATASDRFLEVPRSGPRAWQRSA